MQAAAGSAWTGESTLITRQPRYNYFPIGTLHSSARTTGSHGGSRPCYSSGQRRRCVGHALRRRQGIVRVRMRCVLQRRRVRRLCIKRCAYCSCTRRARRLRPGCCVAPRHISERVGERIRVTARVAGRGPAARQLGCTRGGERRYRVQPRRDAAWSGVRRLKLRQHV